MIAIFLILLSVSLSDDLAMVIEVHRHGARAPVYPLVNITIGPDWSTPPQLIAELSFLGRRQHFLLGKYIKDKYLTPLQISTYDPNLIYTQSSGFNRTIDSALAQLTGMFPDGSGKTVSDAQINYSNPPAQGGDISPLINSLQNQTTLNSFSSFVIHSMDPKLDGTLCPDQGACPRYNNVSNGVKTSTEWTDMYNDYISATGAGTTIAQQFGFDTSQITSGNIITVQDTVITNAFHKLITVDDDTLSRNMQSFQKAFGYVTIGNNATTLEILSKLGASKIMYSIMGFLENKTKHASPLKFVQLSCHDSNILEISAVLGMVDLKNIPYVNFASSMFFELHNNSNTYTVNLVSNGVLVKTYSYADLIKKIKNSTFTPEEWDKQCKI